MKIYRGERVPDLARAAGEVIVTVAERTEETPIVDVAIGPLEHRVCHSHTGFEYGYGGSGPADLARSILWDHTGGPVAPVVYQRFKFQLIATLHPTHPWELAADTIEIALRQIQREAGLACVRCADRGLVESDAKGAITHPCDAEGCAAGAATREEWARDFEGSGDADVERKR